MSRATIRLLSVLVTFAVVAGMEIAPTIAVSVQQYGNLLQNPSFEGSLSGDWQWQFWYYEAMVMKDDNKKEPDLDRSFFAPVFLPSESKWDQESNGAVGTAGAVSNQAWTKSRGGFYQTVDIAPGTCVRFSVWVNEFCQTDDGSICPVLLRAGIDPNGGTNWASNNVQWVQTTISDRAYAHLTLLPVSVGQGGKVTVFTWGEPFYPAHYNAAYFDEASLVVMANACKQIFLPIILLGR